MAKTNNDLKDYLEEDATQQQPQQPQEVDEDEVIDESSSIEPEQTDLPDESAESVSADSPKRSTRAINKLHFWSDWSRNKKIYVFGGGLIASLIILVLSLIFIVQPSNANSYVSKSCTIWSAQAQA